MLNFEDICGCLFSGSASSSSLMSGNSEDISPPYERDMRKLVAFLERHKKPVNACIKRPTDSLTRMLMNIIRKSEVGFGLGEVSTCQV